MPKPARSVVVAAIISSMLAVAACGSSSNKGQSDSKVASCVQVLLIKEHLGDGSAGCNWTQNGIAKVGGSSLKVLCSHSSGNSYTCQASTARFSIYKMMTGSYRVVDDGQNITLGAR